MSSPTFTTERVEIILEIFCSSIYFFFFLQFLFSTVLHCILPGVVPVLHNVVCSKILVNPLKIYTVLYLWRRHFHDKGKKHLQSLEAVSYYINHIHATHPHTDRHMQHTSTQGGLQPPPFTPSAGHQMFDFSPLKGAISKIFTAK